MKVKVIDKLNDVLDLIVSGYTLSFIIALFIISSVCLFLLFKKSGKRHSWLCFVPIFNFIPFFWLINKSPWKILLLLIPFVIFVLPILWLAELLRSFGRNTNFVLLMLFVPGFALFYLYYVSLSSKIKYVY